MFDMEGLWAHDTLSGWARRLIWGIKFNPSFLLFPFVGRDQDTAYLGLLFTRWHHTYARGIFPDWKHSKSLLS